MFRADKMAALGRLMAGVAHEINNPNNFITFNIPVLRDYIDVLRDQLEESVEDDEITLMGLSVDDFFDDFEQILEDMKLGSKRITDIVSELKTYVRSHENQEEKELRNIYHIVQSLITLVGKQINQMVNSFKVKVPKNLPDIFVNNVKIEQLLINLLLNAAQASESANKSNGKDSFVILTASVSESEPKFLEIIVEDNGEGIPTELFERIFDPFFTTKEPDAGTGLGLSICQQIIADHGGSIKVQSILGYGACFTVKIPLGFQ